MSYKPPVPTYAELYRSLEERYKSASKSAADITSEDVEGDDPGALPGSENDKKVPAEMKEPDPEVVDDTVGGTSNYSGEGAEAGSDNPDLEPQLLEADEPVLNPEEKPLDSTDVDAKTASDLGNDLVAMVMENQRKEMAMRKKAGTAKAQPSRAKPAVQKTKQASQPAQDDELVLTNSIMSKIAAVVLSRQEGRELVQRLLSEAAGADFAKQAMDAMGLQGRRANEMSEKQAAYDAYMAEFIKGAQDASDILGAAQDSAAGDAEEAQGASDAEALLGGSDTGDAGDAEEAQGASDAEALLGGSDTGDGIPADDMGAGDEEMLSDDDIADALDDLLSRAETGDITDEEAEILTEAIDQLSDETEDGIAEDDGSDLGSDESEVADEAADAVADEAAAEEGASEEKAPKEASVKRASSARMGKLAEAIQRFRNVQSKAVKAAKASRPVKKAAKAPRRK